MRGIKGAIGIAVFASATAAAQQDPPAPTNGIPQTISFFSVKSALTSGPPPVSAAGLLPPGAVSNRLERGGEASANTTVLLIDQKNTSQADQGFAIQRIVKFAEIRRKGD